MFHFSLCSFCLFWRCCVTFSTFFWFKCFFLQLLIKLCCLLYNNNYKCSLEMFSLFLWGKDLYHWLEVQLTMILIINQSDDYIFRLIDIWTVKTKWLSKKSFFSSVAIQDNRKINGPKRAREWNLQSWSKVQSNSITSALLLLSTYHAGQAGTLVRSTWWEPKRDQTLWVALNHA